MNIFSTFCSLFGFSSSRRITPSNRINNELLFINLAAVRADDFQIPPHRQAVTVVRYVILTTGIGEPAISTVRP